jgi:hypothetical protein
MKKLTFTAVVLMIGTVAFASSLGIPWFVDNCAPGQGSPPSGVNHKGSSATIIFLKNNTAAAVPCTIRYFDQDGLDLGPNGPTDNTFVIPALSAVAFRPVADDPALDQAGTTVIGTEADTGRAVPNRPLDPGPVKKKNGSCVINWPGDASHSSDVQGYAVTYENYFASIGGAQTKALAWAYLLPAGVSN